MDELNHQNKVMKTCFQNANRTVHLLAAVTVANLLVAPASHAAVRYQVLKSFGSSTNDGGNPIAGLIEGSDGALYGTTRNGGSYGSGTVFRLNRDGSGYRPLHHFGATLLADGADSQSGLAEGSDGALYGTTVYGGSNGVGTVFRLLKDGSGYVILHHFSTNRSDGRYPNGRLIEGNDGWLYGTTQWGGTNVGRFSFGGGTVFKLKKHGAGFDLVYSFSAGHYGHPCGGLLKASDGALYGTGRSLRFVFRLNCDGSGFTPLRVMLPGSFGPGEAHLIEGTDGAIYGTAGVGGGIPECVPGGAIFKVNRDFTTYSVFREFQAGSDDWCFSPEGYDPHSGLAQGSDGALYGTLSSGGPSGAGAIFTLDTVGGGFRILHSFSATGADGASPRGSLLKASDGAFYGTTSGGGEFDLGTAFKLWPPPRLLPPLVSNGAVTLRIVDGPGLTNELQRATALDGNWQTLTNLVVPPSGMAEFTDTAPPMPGAFYRCIGR